MKTVRCPKCRCDHVGARPLPNLIAEGSRVIAMALDMSEERAKSFLHAQWYGGALELDGYCRDCIIATLASDRIEAKVVANGEPLREGDLLVPEEGGGVVLPFRAPAKEAVK